MSEENAIALNDDQEEAVAARMTKALADMKVDGPSKPTVAVFRKPVLTEAVESLSTTLVKVESINRGLREKVQSEKMKLQHDYTHKRLEAQELYERQMNEMGTRFLRERDASFQKLADAYHDATREIDMIEARLARGE